MAGEQGGGFGEIDDPVVRNAGVGILAALDDVVGAPGAGRHQLDDHEHLGGPDQTALALNSSRYVSVHHDDVRSADETGRICRGEPEVDVDVLDGHEISR
jgi:hypothetical protein